MAFMTQHQKERIQRGFELAGSIASALFLGFIVDAMTRSSVSSTPRDWSALTINWVVSGVCYLVLFWLFDRFLPLYVGQFRLNWLGISLFGTALSFMALSSATLWSRGSLSFENVGDVFLALTLLTIPSSSVMLIVVGLGSLARFIFREVEEFRVID
jgi:hypothetical protein